MPVSGDAFTRYGGRTTAFAVTAEETSLILDCGTGLVAVADRAATEWHVLLTHYHSDHLQGLQFFEPLFRPGVSFTFYGHRPENMSLRSAIAGYFEPPFFPVTLDETASTKRFVELGSGPISIGSIEVAHSRLNHPQQATAYRLSRGGSSIVVATDHEAGDPKADGALIELAGDADVLVHDAQYTPDDYEAHRGWGHSTWEDAVKAATAAGAGRLVLTSHDPWRSDDEIDSIVAEAQDHFPHVAAAREGMVIET
jgi:phosphoribosyl 1,2-cyclic phosphodiesterase